MKRKNEIKTFCKEYVQLYNLDVIPTIKGAHRIDGAAQIKLKQSYRKDYRIYYNTKYLDCTSVALKAMTFHEMTHIADSIIFRNLPYYEFRKVMSSYSEIHASEIEFDTILQQCVKPISSQSLVYLGNIQTTVENLISVNAEQFKADFYPKTFICLFYAIGYTRALRKYNFDYEKELLNMLPEFEFIHNHIKTILHSDDVDFDTIMDMFKILQESKLKCEIKFWKYR